MNFLLIALYVLFSACGLVLMKYGISKGFSLRLTNGALQSEINLITIVGIVFYVCSFLLSLLVMSKMNLSYFYPVSAGLIYVVVCGLGILLLKETVTVQQWIAMGLILGGVVIMNIGK